LLLFHRSLAFAGDLFYLSLALFELAFVYGASIWGGVVGDLWGENWGVFPFIRPTEPFLGRFYNSAHGHTAHTEKRL